MKRLYCSIAAILFTCLAPPSLCHAQREGQQNAGGIPVEIGELRPATNNLQQRSQPSGDWKPPLGTPHDPSSSGSSNLRPNWIRPPTYGAPPSDPNSSGSSNLRPNWIPGDRNGWTPSPLPNVYPRPTHYNPNRTPSNDTPATTASSYPLPSVAPAETYSRQPIVVRCPNSEDGEVSYVLTNGKGDYSYKMTPGQKQTFAEDAAWTIRYDRGNGGGLREYRLRGGTAYKLVRDDDGYWQLYAERN